MNTENLELYWKSDAAETLERYEKWWSGEGLLIIGGFGTSGWRRPARDGVEKPPVTKLAEPYLNPELFAEMMHHAMATSEFPLDTPPISPTNLGPGNLATYLGSEPGFADDTIWFHPVWQSIENPENLPPLEFDPENKWWKLTEGILRVSVRLGSGKYMTGVPDLVENIDVLASLRDAQTLLMDMIERPKWVEEKVMELNKIWFEAYDRIYDIIKLPDGTCAFWAFGLCGKGKTAKVQCDASAMFSPQMFERFVMPALVEQCYWLDYSMFHLDGAQCIQHLDLILSVPELNAVEWTPDPLSPSGGSPEWFDMYARIADMVEEYR